VSLRRRRADRGSTAPSCVSLPPARFVPASSSTATASPCYPPDTDDEFELFLGVPRGLRCMVVRRRLGSRRATNQPDVGRGTNRKTSSIPCTHVCSNPCPKSITSRFAPHQTKVPPMFQTTAQAGPRHAHRRRSPSRPRPWPVLDDGERWRDIDCGKRAGVRTVFIDFGYHEALQAPPDFSIRSFPKAAGIFLAPR